MKLPPHVDEIPVTIVTDDGISLEGKIHRAIDAQGGVVVCHPNPQQGGTMENKVVTTCVRTCAAHGYSTVRFNFRGVKKSTGTHTFGTSEPRDVIAAIEYLRKEDAIAAQHLSLVGFSFGSAMALEAYARGAVIEKLILIGPPRRFYPFVFPQTLPHRGVHIILGDQDEYCSVEDAQKLIDSISNHGTLHVVPHCGHFFHGQLEQLSSILKSILLHDETRVSLRGEISL